MAKSKLTQLQEALAAGDVETAQRLAGEMAPKKAPRKPAKGSAKAKTTKRTTTRKKATRAKPGPLPEERPEPPAPVRSRNRASYDADDGVNVIYRDEASNVMAGGGSRQVGGDKNYARRQSLAGTQFKPEIIKDNVELPAKHAKLDKKLQKAKVTPRPGQPGADRAVARKIQIRCDGCGRLDEIAEGVFERIDEETQYKCNKCSCRGR
jgi:hypothetical protein